MTVPWKAWKTKYGFFHASHRPLKIPQNRRDFHIPTAQACTAWKSGKPTTGFPLSHPVHAMTTTVLSLNRKTKRKEVGATRPPHSLCRSPSGRAEPISCSSFNWKMLVGDAFMAGVGD